jgi:hypothetical protein
MSAPGAHPHFDDRGTLVWYRRLAQARAAAHAQGCLILIELGRRL